MIKVKEEFLRHRPPFNKLKLGEMSQKQLKQLPKEQQEVFFEVEKKKKAND